MPSILFYNRAKIIIEIKYDKLKITKQRFLNIANVEKEYTIEEIENIEYAPEKTNWLIVLLPGFFGMKSAKLTITKKNGKTTEFIMKLKADDLDILNEFIKKKAKPIR